MIYYRHENKCLRIALGKSQSHCQELIDIIKQNRSVVETVPADLLIVGVGGKISLDEKLLLKDAGDLSRYSFTPASPLSEISPRPLKSATSQNSESRIKVYDKKPRAFVEYIANLKLNKEEFMLEFEKYIEKQENRFQNVMNNIKNLLEKEKATNRKLRHAQAKMGTASTRSEMLTYFSGSMPENSPSQKNIDENKFPYKIPKTRAKTQGGPRKKRLRNNNSKQSKLILRTPDSRQI